MSKGSKPKTVKSLSGIGNDFRTTFSTIKYRLRWELMLQIEEQRAAPWDTAAKREEVFRELGLVAEDGSLLCLVSLAPATSWDHAFTLRDGYGWGINNVIPLCEQINRHEKDHLDLDSFLAKSGHLYPGAAERAERFFQLTGGRPQKVSEKVQQWITNKVKQLERETEQFAEFLFSTETV